MIAEPYQIDLEACAETPRIKGVQLAPKGQLKEDNILKYITHCKQSDEQMIELLKQPLWFFIEQVIDELSWRTQETQLKFYSDRAVEFTLNGHVITFGNIIGGGQGWFIDNEPVRNIYTIKRRLSGANTRKH